MTWIYLAYIAAVFFWQTRAVITGKNTRRKAVALYIIYTAGPVIISGVLFMGLVRYEMFTKTVVMSEQVARPLAFLTAIGAVTVLISALIFALVILVIKSGGNHA